MRGVKEEEEEYMARKFKNTVFFLKL